MNDLSDTARDLALHIENDGPTYHTYFVPMARSMEKAWRKYHTLDRERADAAMLRTVNDVARSLHRETGSMFGPKWNYAYPIADRKAVAHYLVGSLIEEWQVGNFLAS